MTQDHLADLLREGRIESVPADLEAARAGLGDAIRHLDSASTIAERDPNGAYQLLYDGVRKAVSSLMLAEGYRVLARPGAHRAIVRYAEVALAAGLATEHVLHLDRMRRNRNRSEYDVRVFGSAEVAADLVHARGIAAAVAEALQR